MVQSWWITQAADYVSSFSSNSCICHCLIRDQKHTLHGAGVPIAPAVMRKWEAFSFHFYGFSTLRGHSPAGGNSAVFIELGAWHLLGLFWGGRGQRNRAILGNCFAAVCVCGQGMMETRGNDGEMRKWWRDEEIMELFTSHKAEDGVLPKQALCHPKTSIAHERKGEMRTSASDFSISIPPSWRSKRKVALLGKHLSYSGSRWEGKKCRYFS